MNAVTPMGMLPTPHRLFYVPSSLNIPHVFARLPITTWMWPASMVGVLFCFTPLRWHGQTQSSAKTVYGIVAGYRLTAPDFHIGDGKYLAFTWCVPSLHKATHTRTQSRKKGGETVRGG